MPIDYDLETDIRFLQGRQKGIDEALAKLAAMNYEQKLEDELMAASQSNITGLLELNLLSIDQIATALNVPVELVLSLQAQMPGSTNA